MIFGRIRKYTILLSILLVICRFYSVSGLALAQSLLSDRVWFEHTINTLIEKDIAEQNNYARFSGMIHAPLILHQSLVRPVAPKKPEFKFPLKLPLKSNLSQIQAYSNQTDQEWVNNEFKGLSIPFAEIEEMIISAKIFSPFASSTPLAV